MQVKNRLGSESIWDGSIWDRIDLVCQQDFTGGSNARRLCFQEVRLIRHNVQPSAQPSAAGTNCRSNAQPSAAGPNFRGNALRCLGITRIYVEFI